jgi:hypothetical protein
MFKITPVSIKLIIICSFLGLVSACAVTTRSTEGTSETFENTTDASSDFTSSTSPRNDAKHSDAQSVTRFASANLDRLKEDMARGGGEHLTAFARLLGIKEIHQAEFFTVTRQNYPFLFGTEPTTTDDMLARLSTELDAYPTWRQ